MARLEAACDVERLEHEGSGRQHELIARIPGKQALILTINETADRAVIEAGNALRVIANVAVGYNNIDVDAAREKAIVVTNTPDVLTDATADLTWGLMLGITRRIGEGERLVRSGAWSGWAFDQLLGMELRNKQLGIVGFGRIGRAVARRAPVFGMRVAFAARSPYGTPDVAAESMPLDRLLATSDVISLHVPLTPDTKHLIDQPTLARMKRSAYLINTSRGPVIDEAALVWALRNRLIAGAALDVYEREPEIRPELLHLENVMLSPHLGSATTDTRTAMADLAARNVLAVLAGKPALTPVT